VRHTLLLGALAVFVGDIIGYRLQMGVYLHFIEHKQMADEAISAVTVAAKPFVRHELYFTNDGEFRERCSAVEMSMAAAGPDNTHMVVICTHGVEDTGTLLCMGQDNEPLPLLEKPFSSLPVKTLVYLSVCWGGYAANVDRMQACGDKARPVVVGPLVPLWADDGDRLQDELLDVLVTRGLDDAGLADVVRAFNTRLQGEFGQDAARIAMRDGTFEPRKGTAGISWSLLERTDHTVNEGPFVIEAINGNRANLSDGDGHWLAPVGRLEGSKKGKLEVGDRFTFKAKVHPKTNVLGIVNIPTPVV
jgi:hypothetical protein